MLNMLRFLVILVVFVLTLSHGAKSAEPSIILAEARFVDNGDGTITDTKRKIMWQKGDNGKEVTFEDAEKYCKALRLGGHTDWRLPDPEELDTAVVIVLMVNRAIGYVPQRRTLDPDLRSGDGDTLTRCLCPL